MYSSTRCLPYIRNYEEAHRYFTNTRKPPRSVKWAENQRPLKNTSAYHYRIVQHSDGEAYDLVLYHTVMARYYKPEADGFERQLLRGHNSQTSHAFMSDVMGVGQFTTARDLHGNEIAAPIYDVVSIKDAGESFSAEWWINQQGRIDTAQSRHTPHYRFVSSNSDKEARKQIKEALANYITLAALRMTEYVENVDFDNRKGMPFSGHNTNFSQRQAVTEMLNGEPTQVMLNVFFQEIGQEVFDMLASKRAYSQDNFKLLSHWSKAAGHKSDGYDKLEKQITQKEFEQALLKRCIKLADAHRPSDRQELPQFMRKEDYPRTNIHV